MNKRDKIQKRENETKSKREKRKTIEQMKCTRAKVSADKIFLAGVASVPASTDVTQTLTYMHT